MSEHIPGQFEGDGLGRSEIGLRVLCAWDNISLDQALEFWSQHANEATAKAWNRVIKAVREFDAEKAAEATHNPHHPKPLTKPSPLDRESS